MGWVTINPATVSTGPTELGVTVTELVSSELGLLICMVFSQVLCLYIVKDVACTVHELH